MTIIFIVKAEFYFPMQSVGIIRMKHMRHIFFSYQDAVMINFMYQLVCEIVLRYLVKHHFLDVFVRMFLDEVYI